MKVDNTASTGRFIHPLPIILSIDSNGPATSSTLPDTTGNDLAVFTRIRTRVLPGNYVRAHQRNHRQAHHLIHLQVHAIVLRQTPAVYGPLKASTELPPYISQLFCFFSEDICPYSLSIS